MIRLSARFASFAALVFISVPAFNAFGQQQVPPAPAEEPSAPAPTGQPVFPKPDPANFTAASPTKETVNSFLHASWGFDETRSWQVQAILKTPVEGLSKVIILVTDKTGKPQPIGFFALADGKHIIAGDDIVAFGANPYADNRAQLTQRADGPYTGSALKDLEIVEFADFQCPHCKEAQPNMDKLAVDFPKARIVFQFYPLEKIHPAAKKAASYGYCVGKQGGSNAFFQFAAAVFDGQEGLNQSDDAAILTLNAAVVKAGQDPAKIAACAATPATSAAVEASVKLAQDLDVNQTPMLMINGRQVSANAPYDTLKKVVEFQEKLDGVKP